MPRFGKRSLVVLPVFILIRETQMVQIFTLLLLGIQVSDDVGIFPKALWFLHEYGCSDCSSASNDLQLKSVLAKSLAIDRELTLEELDGLIRKDAFTKFAGIDNRLSESEISSALEAGTPSTRLRLAPELRRYAEFLTTSFDMIESEHLDEIDQLSNWIVQNWRHNGNLQVLTTCTGNSRRSILSAAMGNLAAGYYGFDNIRFHSGGTIPSAFNKRTIATLQEIGFQIQPTGEEAERGDPKTSNPIYRVVWGKDLESMEFSKSYKDKSNPKSGFAAILVCNEADAECPTVPGASLRLSMTFVDPKLYDDGVFEKRKYAERRDDIGRTFLAAMANVRRRLQGEK